MKCIVLPVVLYISLRVGVGEQGYFVQGKCSIVRKKAKGLKFLNDEEPPRLDLAVSFLAYPLRTTDKIDVCNAPVRNCKGQIASPP
jgi:hypothetical protein